jgi:hypothetical protein
MKTYRGIRANGAVIGMPTNEYIILDLCSDALSVPSTARVSNAFFSGIRMLGKQSSVFSIPDNSSSLRLAESGGIDLSPHSSKGILFNALLPSSTIVFCHPDSFFSQFAHSFAARAVPLSIRDCLSDNAIFNLWQYINERRVEIGNRKRRMVEGMNRDFFREASCSGQVIPGIN